MKLNQQVSAILVLLAVVTHALAEQQVTLGSGTVLVGNVSLDGDSVVIEIDDASLRVPLKEIATITPIAAGQPGQPERLLMIALETRILRGPDKQGPGLLAEAHRQAPDNARIAFWYAHALEAAGHGKAANVAIEKHRNTILAMFPGVADKLVERIASRMQLERLPQQLVQRIDEFNAVAGSAAMLSSERPATFAFFRIVDQHGEPINRRQFRISCSGSSEELTEYPDGYFAHTYTQYRRSSPVRCKLSFNDYGYEPKEVDVVGSTQRAKDFGTIQVRKFDEAEKKKVAVRIVDIEGKPIEAAVVRVSVSSSYGTNNTTKNWKTNADGAVEFAVFPTSYSLFATHSSYQATNTRIDVQSNEASTKPIRLTMRRAISARLSVEWRSKNRKTGVETKPTQTIVEVVGGRLSRNQIVPWLQAVQQKDNLILSILGAQQRLAERNNAEDWLRVHSLDHEEDTRLMAHSFSELRELKEKLGSPPSAGPSSYSRGFSVKADPKQILIGEVNHPDYNSRDGGTTYQFRIVIEKLSQEKVK